VGSQHRSLLWSLAEENKSSGRKTDGMGQEELWILYQQGTNEGCLPDDRSLQNSSIVKRAVIFSQKGGQSNRDCSRNILGMQIVELPENYLKVW
jgi:hypothetical protein